MAGELSTPQLHCEFSDVLYNSLHMSSVKELLSRVENWPKDAQDELARSMTEIQSRYGNIYRVDQDEREALTRSGDDVRNSRFASDADVEDIFSRFHRA